MSTDYALRTCARLALIAALACFVFLETRAQEPSLRGQVRGPFGGASSLRTAAYSGSVQGVGRHSERFSSLRKVVLVTKSSDR